MTRVVGLGEGIKNLQTDAGEIVSEFLAYLKRPQLKRPATKFVEDLVDNDKALGAGLYIERKGIWIFTISVFVDLRKRTSWKTTDALIDAFAPVQSSYTGQTFVQLHFWNTKDEEINEQMKAFLEQCLALPAVKCVCLAKN